jgi:hypothetical protein
MRRWNYSLRQTPRSTRPHLLTVSLTVDYVAAAQDSDWLEASATVTRILPAGTGGHRSAVSDEFSAVPPSYLDDAAPCCPLRNGDHHEQQDDDPARGR